jgi:hypothetical protein
VDPPRYLPGVIRFFVALVLVVMLAWCGATVKLGKRTFFGHVAAIWKTDEAQDMKEGVEEKAGPAAKKLKRGVEAGYREATKDEKPAPDKGTGH